MIGSGPLREALEDLGPGFELVGELGRGATAVVYLVRDRPLDRQLALKVIRSSFVHDEEALARLQREARLVARLQHPNIVQLYGTRQLSDGSMVLIMEHVPGRTLKEIIRAEGRMAPARGVAILKDVASALAFAHRRRIVHRDVKPENIYVDEEIGAARLADFGIARPWDQDSRLTLPGGSLGTPAYMSPEQVDGREVDGRSDVYSLALVGYEMLAGGHPWEQDNLYTLIFKQKTERLPSLMEIRGDLPPFLVAVLEKALSKDPADRWRSADAMLKALTAGEVPDDVFPAGVDLGAAPPAPLDLDFGEASLRPEDVDFGEALAGPAGGSPGPLPVDLEPDPGTSPPGGDRATPSAPPVPETASGAMAPEATVASDLADVGAEAPPAPLPRRRRHVGKILAGVLALVVTAGAAMLWLADEGGGRGDGSGAAVQAAEPAPPEPLAARDPVPATPAGESAVAEPPTLLPVGGSERTGRVGLPLEPGPAVLVHDASGLPVPGVPVRFVVEEGRAALALTESVTDSAGVARAGVVVPAAPGPLVIRARPAEGTEGADGPAAGAVFRATVLPAAVIAAAGGGDQGGEAGSVLPRPLSIRVTDTSGEPIEGAEVAFRTAGGGGMVTPELVRTDPAGWAVARWSLGPGEGVQTAEASIPVVRDTVVLFEATARPVESAETAAGREGDAAPVDEAAAAPVAEEPPTPEPPVTVTRSRVAVGGTHVCRTGGGGATCRGALGGAALESVEIVSVAAGVGHACALDASGAAWCWGANGSGQLGDGSRTDRSEGSRVSGEVPFSTLALGLAHTCALDARGRPFCWGRNLNGQLGDGGRDDRMIPRPAAGGKTFRSLVAGWNHTCGLEDAGAAWCWGLNAGGQLGEGSRVDRPTPARVNGGYGFRELVAGSAHTCGRTGDSVLCWGENAAGQLGDGTTVPRSGPTPVEGLPRPPVDLAAGAVHTCALLDDGSLWCWGQNVHGQLGDGSTGSRPAPAPVPGHTFVSVEAGGGSTCAVTREGARLCWGLNQSGQLGDGTRTNRSTPTPSGGGASVGGRR